MSLRKFNYPLAVSTEEDNCAQQELAESCKSTNCVVDVVRNSIQRKDGREEVECVCRSQKAFRPPSNSVVKLFEG